MAEWLQQASQWHDVMLLITCIVLVEDLVYQIPSVRSGERITTHYNITYFTSLSNYELRPWFALLLHSHSGLCLSFRFSRSQMSYHVIDISELIAFDLVGLLCISVINSCYPLKPLTKAEQWCIMCATGSQGLLVSSPLHPLLKKWCTSAEFVGECMLTW